MGSEGIIIVNVTNSAPCMHYIEEKLEITRFPRRSFRQAFSAKVFGKRKTKKYKNPLSHVSHMSAPANNMRQSRNRKQF